MTFRGTRVQIRRPRAQAGARAADRPGMPRPSTARRLTRALAGLAGLGVGGAALADPAAYVFVPYADPGARIVAWAAGTARGRDGARETQQTLELGGNPAGRWFTALYAAWASPDGAGYRFDEWSWLNHVALTEPGAAPVDVGALCEIERAREQDEGTGLLCGPTLQADTDRLQLNLNLLLGRHVGADEPEPWRLHYQWQAKALLAPGVELGAQGFGEAGAPPSHVLGPAIFAKVAQGAGRALQFDAAWLVGIGAGSPRDVLRVRVQQQF